MTESIYFKCQIECSYLCCGGATVVILPELRKFYKYFPITVAFQKVYPLDSYHENYIKDITFKYGDFYIIGDFIAGNRFNKKCRHLRNSLCLLHGKTKPLQCKIVPFSVTFPENYQNIVIKERRKSAFKNCKGFRENAPKIWQGSFLDEALKSDFEQLRKSLIFQKELMERIFKASKKSINFSKFILSKFGILELPLTEEFIYELFNRGHIEEPVDFLKQQKRFFITELMNNTSKNSLFSEALSIIEKLIFSYSKQEKS